MAEFTLVIDHDKCTGCGVCEMVCAMHSGHGFNPQKARIRVIALEGETALSYLPVTCMQCEKPPCEAICPTGAISGNLENRKKAEIDEETCIGCTLCAKVCPVDAIEGELKKLHKVDIEKCIGCGACVEKCPKDAITLK